VDDDVVGLTEVVLTWVEVEVEVTTVVWVVVVDVGDGRCWVTVVRTETRPVTVTGTLDVSTGTPVTLTGSGRSGVRRPATSTAATSKPPANPATIPTAVDPRLGPIMPKPPRCVVTQLTR
jgi:hypothetical protein